ncbi:hypothetical protein CCACVL1_16634 [Corchorus capsularis]|uniref:Uncharacterized protein n=1 Tax=Corchorus capsularis TaxID=210143 RepID=A0A1R3HW60_COCAP|nr:hypothetical protein CCACVL1_16634 [Corchorus capsularis]
MAVAKGSIPSNETKPKPKAAMGSAQLTVDTCHGIMGSKLECHG